MIALYLSSYHSYGIGKKRPQEVEDTHSVLDQAFRLLSFKERELALHVVDKLLEKGFSITTKGLDVAVKHAESIIANSKKIIASIILILAFAFAAPSYGQLAPALPGIVAPTPLVFYRVAFISKGKHLSFKEVHDLLISLAEEPIAEKYILTSRENNDHTFEIEMKMRIVFFDRKEAEKALAVLKDNSNYDSAKFDLEVVKESQI